MNFDKLYTTFERGVAAVLMIGMAVVILLATFSFLRSTLDAALNFESALDYTKFQLLFDRVLAAIIALELAHSVQQMAAGQRGLIQVKTVIAIGVLAVVRKLILLEVETTSGLFLIGIAAAILSLGIVLALTQWIGRVRNEDDEVVPSAGSPSDGASGNNPKY